MKHEKAWLQDYDKAIELNPQDAETYNNRGIAYNNLGQ
jgi:Flp pilus assembly protein TadD